MTSAEIWPKVGEEAIYSGLSRKMKVGCLYPIPGKRHHKKEMHHAGGKNSG